MVDILNNKHALTHSLTFKLAVCVVGVCVCVCGLRQKMSTNLQPPAALFFASSTLHSFILDRYCT